MTETSPDHGFEPRAVTKAPTIYDVALVAGVSHQTVSRFIKGHRVSDLSRERVERAISQLDFQPSQTARALATRRSTRIGALAFEMTHFGPMASLSAAAAAARESGFVLDVVTIDPADRASAAAAIELVNQRDLAGVLAFTPNDVLQDALQRTSFRIPVYIENEGAERVGPGNVNYDAGALVAHHLLELGHRSLAQITGPAGWPAARLRSAGFTEALRDAGLEVPSAAEGDWGPASGYQAMTDMIRSGRAFTGIFAANDQMAIGALAALAEAGIAVPQDVSVAGIDDQPEAAYVAPPLTTVPMNFADQGRRIFNGLLARMAGQDPRGDEHELPARLIVRSTTGPFRG